MAATTLLQIALSVTEAPAATVVADVDNEQTGAGDETVDTVNDRLLIVTGALLTFAVALIV